MLYSFQVNSLFLETPTFSAVGAGVTLVLVDFVHSLPLRSAVRSPSANECATKRLRLFSNIRSSILCSFFSPLKCSAQSSGVTDKNQLSLLRISFLLKGFERFDIIGFSPNIQRGRRTHRIGTLMRGPLG